MSDLLALRRPVFRPAPRIERGEWPQLDDCAFYGCAGDFVRALDPHTEADPVAVLIHYLAAFGNIIGRTAHWRIGATIHHCNLFAVIAGSTATGRKGTSWAEVRALFEAVDEPWFTTCIASSFTSGEGLINFVRDPCANDPGALDKRLLIVQSEFASVLKVAAREGNTLSDVVRQAWDGDRLHALSKSNPITATGAHVSIVGHVTPNELTRLMTATEQANGFGNRFLWLLVRRSKELPHGGSLSAVELERHRAPLRKAIDFARTATTELKREGALDEFWGSMYHDLTRERPGMVGELTARAVPQTNRLAVIYAALDCSTSIKLHHLAAAYALWSYSEASCAYLFGEQSGNPLADEVVAALKKDASGLRRSEISAVFARHVPAAKLDEVLLQLQRDGVIIAVPEETGGRRAMRYLLANRSETST